MWIERLMAGISHQHVLSYNPILYFYRKNIDMSNKKRYKKRENFATRGKA